MERSVFTSDCSHVWFASSDPNEKVDTHRWREELHTRKHLPTEQLLKDFMDHIDRESGSLRPKDDLTIIVIEVK